MKKEGYPVRYVVLTFFKNDCYFVGEVGYDFFPDVNGYVIAPAYLISENHIYYEDGTAENIYKIVLPFEGFNNSKEIEPIFDDFGECVNSYEVGKLFSNIFDAEEYTNMLNDDLKRSVIYRSNDRFDAEKRINSFESDLSKYKEMEMSLILRKGYNK